MDAHVFTRLLNEFHASFSDDNQIATPTGLAPHMPTLILDSPAAFTLGNAPFSIGRVFERQWSLADRLDYVAGRHTLQAISPTGLPRALQFSARFTF